MFLILNTATQFTAPLHAKRFSSVKQARNDFIVHGHRTVDSECARRKLPRGFHRTPPFALRLSCTGQTDQYMKWLESTRRPPMEDGSSSSTSTRPLSYLEQLEQRRLEQSNNAVRPRDSAPEQTINTARKRQGFWKRLQGAFTNLFPEKETALQRLRSYGLAAILAYGFFDAITYSASFVIALITFKRATDNAPLTWQNFLKVVAGMWLLNNFSRPFRIAGALLLAPLVDQFVVKPVARRFKPMSG